MKCEKYREVREKGRIHPDAKNTRFFKRRETERSQGKYEVNEERINIAGRR